MEVRMPVGARATRLETRDDADRELTLASPRTDGGGGGDGAGGNASDLAEQATTVQAAGAQPLGSRAHDLPVRHGGEECRVQPLGPDGEALGVAADAREPMVEDAAREELVGDLRDDGATRAVFAGEAVLVDGLLALGCISRRGRFGILSDV